MRIKRRIVRMLVGILVVLVLGVVGLRVAITQPMTGRDPLPSGAQADPEALRGRVLFLCEDVKPRYYGRPENLSRAADYIRDAFGATGAEVTEQTYEAGGDTFRNVIARLGGKNGPRIIVGAHYDVFGELPGADDNASGTAGLLEVARVLASRDISVPVELVAYSTEEPPFFASPQMGSAVHAASLIEAKTPVKAMICLEMIGYFSGEQSSWSSPLRLFYPGRGDFIMIAGRWRDRPLIADIKRSFRGASDLDARSYCGPTSMGTDLSDHRNYWANDISAVMITDTAFLRNSNYHRTTDRPDTLDYDRMANVVDGVVNAVIHLDLGE
ncbi:MAG: peptidase M28 [Planctomycetaceae bacterium]|nr:peptidase M28 [Planctomycetaceae bacterium]